MTSFEGLVRRLNDRDIRYVVFGVWGACEDVGLHLLAGHEPLDIPRDLELARRVVERNAATRATDGRELDVDLSLVMAGHDFDDVWAQRRTFLIEGAAVPVARLRHIVASKAAAGREKDRLFLATHADTLRRLTDQDP